MKNPNRIIPDSCIPVTGRWSSSEPNAQNIPRKEGMEPRELVAYEADYDCRTGEVRVRSEKLLQLEDDPIVCRSCGRVGAHVREKRDEGTFIVCKCGEDLEQVTELKCD